MSHAIALDLRGLRQGDRYVHAALLGGGNFAEATELLSRAIARLHAADELLFQTCTREGLAALILATAQNTPGNASDRKAHAWGESDRADEESRRKRAYILRHRILDAGGTLPAGDDAALDEDPMVKEADAASSRKFIAQPFSRIAG